MNSRSLFGFAASLTTASASTIDTGEAVEVAAVAFLDLELERAHPEAVAGAVWPDRVVAAAAVAHGLFARRPPLVAPTELESEVVVLVVRTRDQPTELSPEMRIAGRAIDLDDGEDAAGIAVEPDRLRVFAACVLRQSRHVARLVWAAEVGVPAGQIAAVPQGRPATRLRGLEPVDGERNGGERFQCRPAIERRSVVMVGAHRRTPSSPHRPKYRVVAPRSNAYKSETITRPRPSMNCSAHNSSATVIQNPSVVDGAYKARRHQ